MIRILIGLIFFSTAAQAQNPGGVSGNLLFWVKSNTGVFEADASTAEDGDPVDNWDDNAAADNDAITGLSTEDAGTGTRPIYRTGIINGYPALQFDGTKLLDTETILGIGNTESFYTFLVFRQNSFQTNGGMSDGSGTFIIDRPTATLNLTSFKVVNTDKYGYQRREDNNNNLGGPISITPVNTSSFVIADYYRNTVSTREGIYLNGKLEIDQAGVSGNIPAPRFRIGRHATNLSGGLNGYFAELAVYNVNLSAAERQRIESYFAIKYGITLDQTTATDYVRSDGTVIYSATTFSGYLSDVAGIGRDDGSGLNQSASQSQNANSVIRISNPSSLNNNFDELIWGSNNGSLTTPNTSDLPTGYVRRLSRVWRASEPGGNIGNVTVTVDLSAVPGAKTAAHLRLLVDGNGVFSGGATAYAVTSSSGSTFTFTGVAINNGNYFTIGSTDIATPLPIELTSFNVVYESPVVNASWQTSSELDNDFFTIERSGPNFSFTEIAKVPGAGTTKEPRSYFAKDISPFEGWSYYRLKQTDFNGTETYSDLRSVFIPETGKKLILFPNPSDGKSLHFQWGNAAFALTKIEILNQQGATVFEAAITGHWDQTNYSVELPNMLTPGLYFVKCYFNGKHSFEKLMVTR